MGRFTVFVLIAGFIFTSLIAEEIRIINTDWEPYTGRNLPNLGFSSDVVKSAFEEMGYKVIIDLTDDSWTDVLNKVKTGEYDALYDIVPNAERAKIYAFSEPYTLTQLYFCSYKKDISYSKLDDLRAYKIGTVTDYGTIEEFDSAPNFKKVEFPSEIEQVQGLIDKKVDLIIIDKFVVIHLMNTEEAFIPHKGKVKLIEPSAGITPLNVAFSKNTPNVGKKVLDFNEGLEKLRASGKYEEILKKHGLDKF